MQSGEKSAKLMEKTTVKSEPVGLPILPDDLIVEMILPRLPVKLLSQFKSVSKYWLTAISSNKFAKTHLKFQSSSSDTKTLIYREVLRIGRGYGCFLSLDENYNMKEFVRLDVKYLKNETNLQMYLRATRVIGSFNGLLCMFNHKLQEFMIWNPVTNQYHNASKPKFNKKCVSKSYDFGVGFGYISSIDDYRIGYLLYSLDEIHHIHVNVYSLKTGEWEETACLDKDTSDNLCIIPNYYSVFVNDTIYWSPGSSDHIVGMNLVSGKVKKIHLEDLLTGYVNAKVFEVKGCLTLCRTKKINGGYGRRISDVLTFKTNGDETYTLEESFSVNVQGLTIVHIFETGICLVTRNSNQVMLFDPSQEKSWSIEDDKVTDYLWKGHTRNFRYNPFADVWAYTESLVSPSGLCARVVNEADGDGNGNGNGDDDENN